MSNSHPIATNIELERMSLIYPSSFKESTDTNLI